MKFEYGGYDIELEFIYGDWTELRVHTTSSVMNALYFANPFTSNRKEQIEAELHCISQLMRAVSPEFARHILKESLFELSDNHIQHISWSLAS